MPTAGAEWWAVPTLQSGDGRDAPAVRRGERRGRHHDERQWHVSALGVDGGEGFGKGVESVAEGRQDEAAATVERLKAQAQNRVEHGYRDRMNALLDGLMPERARGAGDGAG